MHHIAFLDNVFLALQPQFPRFLGARFALVREEVIVGDHFRPDEAALEVGMYDSSRAGSLGATLDRPGANFLNTRCEVGDQTE